MTHAAENLQVRDAMSTEVLMIGPLHTLRHAAKLMSQRHVGSAIVHNPETSGIGIDIADDSEIYWLPPHLEAFQPAEPGEYRLRSTGEVLVDPDFVSTWTIEKDDSEDRPETSDRGYESPQ